MVTSVRANPASSITLHRPENGDANDGRCEQSYDQIQRAALA
jgi:hypothetical protein